MVRNRAEHQEALAQAGVRCQVSGAEVSGAERWSQSLGLDPSAVAFQLLWVSGTYVTVHNRGKLTVMQQQGNHLVGEHSPGRCVTAGRVRKVGTPGLAGQELQDHRGLRRVSETSSLLSEC